MAGVLKGHPRGVKLIAVVEVWERFSFYGMRGLLVLFLVAAVPTGGFGWSAEEALRFYGAYTGLFFAAPLLGGYLSDRFLGARRSFVLGGALMAAGHFMMAGPAFIPWLLEQVYQVPVAAALALPGCPSPGLLWLDDGTSNAILRCVQPALSGGPAVPAWVMPAAYIGSGASFYLAIGLLILGSGFFRPGSYSLIASLYDSDDPRREQAFYIVQMGINTGAFLSNLVVGSVGERLGWHVGFTIAGFGMLTALIIFRLGQASAFGADVEPPALRRVERRRLGRVKRSALWAAFVTGLVVGLYWMCAEQAGGLLTLFAAERVDRDVSGFIIPASWFLSLNPLMIILFSPAAMGLWAWIRSRRGQEWPVSLKFALGFAWTTAGFLLLVWAAERSSADPPGISPLWLVGVYLLITLGELCINSVGANFAGRFAPRGQEGFVIAIFFLVVAAGHYASGFIGSLIAHYDHVTIFGGLALVAAALALLLPATTSWWNRFQRDAPGTLQ